MLDNYSQLVASLFLGLFVAENGEIFLLLVGDKDPSIGDVLQDILNLGIFLLFPFNFNGDVHARHYFPNAPLFLLDVTDEISDTEQFSVQFLGGLIGLDFGPGQITVADGL